MAFSEQTFDPNMCGVFDYISISVSNYGGYEYIFFK